MYKKIISIFNTDNVNYEEKLKELNPNFSLKRAVADTYRLYYGELLILVGLPFNGIDGLAEKIKPELNITIMLADKILTLVSKDKNLSISKEFGLGLLARKDNTISIPHNILMQKKLYGTLILNLENIRNICKIPEINNEYKEFIDFSKIICIKINKTPYIVCKKSDNIYRADTAELITDKNIVNSIRAKLKLLG